MPGVVLVPCLLSESSDMWADSVLGASMVVDISLYLGR